MDWPKLATEAWDSQVPSLEASQIASLGIRLEVNSDSNELEVS